MGEGWMIDELDYAGHEHLDPAYAAGYERKQGNPDLSDDMDVLAAHGLVATSTIVDIGAGTGLFALAAARRFGHVIAVDVSEAMLRLVRTRASEAGLANIDCVQAGFLTYKTYKHVGAPADAVYSRNALHHLPDFWKGLALVRIAQILRPGGMLRLHDLIYDFRPIEAERVFDLWLGGASSDRVRGYTREDLAEHIRTEYSTFRWLLEPMLASCGFEVVTADFSRSVYGSYTCVKR